MQQVHPSPCEGARNRGRSSPTIWPGSRDTGPTSSSGPRVIAPQAAPIVQGDLIAEVRPNTPGLASQNKNGAVRIKEASTAH